MSGSGLVRQSLNVDFAKLWLHINYLWLYAPFLNATMVSQVRITF